MVRFKMVCFFGVEQVEKEHQYAILSEQGKDEEYSDFLNCCFYLFLDNNVFGLI